MWIGPVTVIFLLSPIGTCCAVYAVALLPPLAAAELELEEPHALSISTAAADIAPNANARLVTLAERVIESLFLIGAAGATAACGRLLSRSLVTEPGLRGLGSVAAERG
jgi:hypothetical protein